MAGSMSDVYEKRVLDLIFRNALASATAPLGLDATNVWVALGTAAADGTFTELPNAGAYARQAVARSGTPGWAAATGTSPATTNNSGTINFPTASASWGTVTHFAICDLGTYGGGNVIYWADLTNSKTIGIGDTASFAASAIAVTQD